MPKRILLFSDGTGNSSAKAQKTNVWRLFQAVDLTGDDQIAFYDDGVGTSKYRYLALLGGVFGWGLKRNVIDLYKFVCRNYRGGDEISGFGFSRGSFTIRVLTGMIHDQGLLKPMSEEELDRYSRAVYRAYRAARFRPNSPLVRVFRKMRDGCLWAYDRLRGFAPYTKNKNISDIPVRFLGLWDTVDAYEIPINELKRAVDVAFWPMTFTDRTLPIKVQRACHALSLDDARVTFHPVLWDEAAEARLVEDGTVRAGRLTQVWFPGVHSNVGGGYPEDRLSYMSLHWLMSEARAVGISFHAGAISKIAHEKSPFARMYDSRAGLWAFYRYGPRRIPIEKDATGQDIYPIIDSSVLIRMADGTDQYAPVPLGSRFWLLEPTGSFRAMAAPDSRPTVAAPPASTPAALLGSKRALTTHMGMVAAAYQRYTVPNVTIPDPAALQIVQDTVWWRRCMYVIQMLLGLLLLLFPLYTTVIPRCIGSACRPGSSAEAVAVYDDAVSKLIDLMKGFLPSLSTPWTDAFGRHPDAFALLLTAFVASLYQGSVLKTRIADRARIAWHANFRSTYRNWCRLSVTGSCRATAAALPIVLVATAWQWIHAANTHGRMATGIELGLVAIALAMLLGWRIYQLKVLNRAIASGAAAPPTTFALQVARWLRTNPIPATFGKVFARFVAPTAFILVVLALVGALANRAVFDATAAAGKVCIDDHRASPDFATSDLCWPSGIDLREGGKYQITLSTPGDWFDASQRADVARFSTDTLVHGLAIGLKRSWRELWFKPIARIGSDANDDYPLDPVQPFSEHRYQSTMADHKPRLDPIPRNEIAARTAPPDHTPSDRMTLTAQITARRSGELFLYVNDAVLSYSPRCFYRNNTGTAKVTVERLCPDGSAHPLGRAQGGVPQDTQADMQCSPAPK